ncbi:MAG TPA: arylamine N-acetyltransferase [Pseudoduganella sp.]
MSPAIDALSSYFDLIGVAPGAAPSPDGLARLQRGHIEAIPFENLTPLAGLPVPLDLSALLAKFTQRRGGYCFEHNLLYRHALETLGYDTTPLLARVRINAAPGVVTPRTHMLLLADIDGERFISDTGFGKATPTAPLRLAPGLAQATPHGMYRITEDGDGYTLESETDGGWAPLYAFDLRPAYPVDIEMSNWYVSTHPASHFTRDLIAVRTVDGGRHVLHNARYAFHGIGAPVTRRELASGDAIAHELETTFGLAAGRVAGLAARLNEIARRPPGV